jgi:hypothetical protein
MSVVGTNFDPSDAIHLWIPFFFSFCLPKVTPGTLNSTPRQVSRVKSPNLVELLIFRLTKHTPALGSSSGRHRIPEASRGQFEQIMLILTSVVGTNSDPSDEKHL